MVQDPIDYLVRRRFPMLAPIRKASKGTISLAEIQQLNVTKPYRDELSALSSTELAARVRKEKERELAESQAKTEREERERFFSLPRSRADFKHWSKTAHWTLDEAIALSFGRAPEIVMWERVAPLVHVSPFARQYQKRRDLVQRARSSGQLRDTVKPAEFLSWIRNLHLEIPTELESAVGAMSSAVDWRAHYTSLKAIFDKHEAKWEKQVREQSEQINLLHAEVEGLRSLTLAPPPPEIEKPLKTRERDSLLKLIIGMAMGGYGFVPSASRSEQPAAIASDLDLAGVPLDVDTVRKWVKTAAELLPSTKPTG